MCLKVCRSLLESLAKCNVRATNQIWQDMKDRGLEIAGPSDSRVLEAEATMLSISESGHFDLTLMLDLKVSSHL